MVLTKDPNQATNVIITIIILFSLAGALATTFIQSAEDVGNATGTPGATINDTVTGVGALLVSTGSGGTGLPGLLFVFAMVGLLVLLFRVRR